MSLRVCLLSSEYPPETAAGGIGTYSRDLARALARQGHDVTVVSSTPAGASESSTVRDGVRVVRVEPRGGFRRRVRMRGRGDLVRSLVGYSERAVETVEALSAKLPFDVVEAPLWNGEASSWPASGAPPLVTRLVTPVFKSVEITGGAPLLELEALERTQCERSTVLAAISHAIGHLVVNHYGLDPAAVVHAPLGIPPGPAPTRHKAGHQLLFVGRLERRKGIDDLVAALPALLSEFPRLHVDVVGSDTGQAIGYDSYEAWVDAVLAPELRARVRFHGFVDEAGLADLYERASVFVAPSRYESFGLVYLEAMARGVPVVGTDVGGVPDIVDDSVGRLVPAADPAALAAAVRALLFDDAERELAGRRARERVVARFSDDAMAVRAVQVYELAISRTG